VADSVPTGSRLVAGPDDLTFNPERDSLALHTLFHTAMLSMLKEDGFLWPNDGSWADELDPRIAAVPVVLCKDGRLSGHEVWLDWVSTVI
jgi:hypothetical protein